jgi:prefoldin subunit 5
VKILAVFFLSGFFLFFPAAGVVPLCAQHYNGMLVDRRQQYSYEGAGIKSDEEKAIQDLQARCQKLEQDIQMMQLLDTMPTDKRDLQDEIESLQNRLNETDMKLSTAEERIKMLESSFWALSHPASKPKAGVNKPKPAVDSPKDR